MKYWIVAIATTCFVLLLPQKAETISIIDVPQDQIVLPVKPVASVSLIPALQRVCSCESTGRPDREPRQFNADGSVVHGKINQHDIGMCQINETYNGDDAKAHGWDIYTRDGNIKMANYLYETQGRTPWNWSKSCWAQ